MNTIDTHSWSNKLANHAMVTERRQRGHKWPDKLRRPHIAAVRPFNSSGSRMHPNYYRVLGVTTVLVVCSTFIVGWVLRRPLKPQNASIDDKSIHNTDVLLQLGSGMGPNLMTPANDHSAELSFDELAKSVSEELDADGTTTRRYMSALIAGEGCNFYVDNGDGHWVLVDDDVADSDPAGTDDDPFGKPLIDSNPFD